ncbi:MAG: MOSC domain-containing protein [Actinomycetota bacterium]
MVDHTDQGPGDAPSEECAQCGFDSRLYNRADTISSQRAIASVLGAAVEGVGDESLHRRPDASTWSIIEYLDHVREVVFGNRMAIEMARADPGVDLGNAPESGGVGAPRNLRLQAVLEGLTEEYRRMAALLAGLDAAEWDLTVRLDGRPHGVGWFARHVLHDGLHHLHDVGRIRHRMGLGAPTGSGAVIGLYRSDGGVPKQPVERVAISGRGLDGDAQADRRHHGRPLQAVCLWGGDVIDRLRADGHPIHPGAAGENITIGGIDWSALRPGARVDVGHVPLLISAYAIPCAKNARWFADGDVARIRHERNPGMSRLYAIPLAPGRVEVGDRVTVEPR